jgi:hypothetical protein
VRDVDGLIVEDTYSVGEVEGIVTGKELFTTGEFIDALIGLIGTIDTEGDTSDTESDTSDTEGDTREKVEGSLAHLITSICYERLRTNIMNMDLVARHKDEFIRILDRQAAITERETRVRELYRFEENHRWHIRSLEEVNRRLNERIDRQRDVIDRCRIAYNAVRGLFDDDSGAGRMA